MAYSPNLSIKWTLASAVLLVPLMVGGIAPLFQLVAPGILVVITEGLSLGLANSIILGNFALGVLLCWLVMKPEALVWLIQTAGLAIVLVVARKQNWPGIKTLLAGFAYLCVTFIVILIAGSGPDLLNGYNKVVQAISEDLDQSLALYKKTSSGIYQAELENWFRQFKEVIIRFLPGLLGSVFLIISLSNILVPKIYLAKELKNEAFAPVFTQWKLPEPLIWVIITAGGLAFLGKGILKVCGENALLVLSSIYFFQGIAVVAFYFGRLKVPAFIRWITYILLCIQWYGLIFIVIIGLSDVWFNLRAKALSGRES
ncbi:MAG: YybS family protein [Deltaproteobacteria bacterium]|nr:YybS family protein [Deltaproteobacteria bacterium]MDL1960771.1 YybS family protein [Deltaproteobacteria bacterium]